MSEHGKCCDTIEGVGCDVETCMYNTDGKRCHADHIQVQNDRAHNKNETFCGTFTQKNNATF